MLLVNNDKVINEVFQFFIDNYNNFKKKNTK